MLPTRLFRRSKGVAVVSDREWNTQPIRSLALLPGWRFLLRLTQPVDWKTWRFVRTDPGSVLLLLQNVFQDQSIHDILNQSAKSVAPQQIETIYSQLRVEHATTPWSNSLQRPAIAKAIATMCRKIDPEIAWCLGLIDQMLCEGLEDFDHQSQWPGWYLSLPESIRTGWDFFSESSTPRAILALTRELVHGGIAPKAMLELGLTEGELPAIIERSNAILAEQKLIDQTIGLEGPFPFLEQLAPEIKKTQLELHGAREEIETRLHELKLRGLAEFCAGASHEINNPLAVISGRCQYLERTEKDPARKETLESIRRQTQRIHHLLRDMMQFARPSHPTREELPLLKSISLWIDRSGPECASKGIALQFVTPPNLQECWAEVDQNQLQRAIHSLIQNAIEANSSTGWIRVQIQLPGDEKRIEISISDGGTGLNPLEREHLFDPFFSGRSAGRGRGFGLPIAWSYLRQNGGDLKFDPSETRSTRFVIILPISRWELSTSRMIA
jgi:signal transduction histidine kinase